MGVDYFRAIFVSSSSSQMTFVRYAILMCIFLGIFGSSMAYGEKLSYCVEPDWHQCSNGRCMSQWLVCDGDDDCGDNSDEANCPDKTLKILNVSCSTDQFKCKDDTCILLEDFCDRQHDCPDGSDEYDGCTEHKKCDDFRCNNGYCIMNQWVCDGFDDCSDFSDEINCGNRTIPPEQCNNYTDRFLCDHGRCILLNNTCDGLDDCGDNSDEHETGCKISEEMCKTDNGCSHYCNKTPKGPSCSCPTGHRLINNHNCADINECKENPELCDQRCANNAGSYNCICEVGYELQDDKKTCKVKGGEALMIFSSRKEIRGLYLESQIYFSIAHNLKHAVAVSLDANYIYWSDVKNGDEAIIRSLEDGTKPEIIVTAGLGKPEDIAVDWITGNIYFTDSLWKRIGVCETNGNYCTIIINESLDMPRGLALYPLKGMMYWSDFGEKKPHISRAIMDGSGISHIVTENLEWPNGLAIDYPNERLYWVDAKREIVESCRLDGTDRRHVLRTIAGHPYAIAIFENKLYWSDWNTKTVHSAEKFDGKNRTTLVRESETIYGIHIYHSVLKPKVLNPCEQQGCSQLCLLAANLTYTCACSLDSELSVDRHNCVISKRQRHLIVASGDTLIDYYHEIIGKPRITVSSTLKRIMQIAYDPLDDSIIANDQSSDTIVSLKIGNDNVTRQVASTRSEYLGGMDFDDRGNNIYWTDTQRRGIVIDSLETGERTIFRYIEEPHDILLITKEATMFVVFKSVQNRYHIDEIRMSGAGSRVHLIEDLQGPRISLAHDPELDRIFWSDESTGRIETINRRGNEERRLFRSGLRGPVCLAIVDNEVFWTLRDSKILQWADKRDHRPGVKGVTLDVQANPGIMHLAASGGVYEDNRNHKCRSNNGGCSHVCLVATMNYHICACPTGMILNDDKRTCSLQINCTVDEIRCSGNNECVSKVRRCNGIKDCPNGEDEEKCERVKTCGIGEFSCNNGQCIDMKNRCNSFFDCSDQSDETNCDKEDCNNDEFQCMDGQCITKFHVCDGHNDCDDFSDETNCASHVCDDSSFRCGSGTCIPKSWQCDGTNDCDDSSDEANENCKISKCPSEMFECENKRCLGRLLVCDNVDDCEDNSDEKECKEKSVAMGKICTGNEYKCHETEKCISLKLRCNGEQDCPKNDDEHHCTECEPNEFACENKKCIPQKWMCDQYNDCGDKSDETNCDIINHNKSRNFTISGSNKCREFRCTIGNCLPYEKVCDGNRDCFDGSDEDGQCSSSCASINACEQICQKTPAGPFCLCQKGYSLKNDGRSCEDINECELEICSQICRNEVGSYACSCFEGYVLRSNRISCKVAGEAMEIITATKSDIRKISSSLSTIKVIHRQPNVDITGLDVNMKEETIYWSNDLIGTINRLNLRTNEFKLVSGAGRPGVIAIDWATDNVYFHDREKPSSIKACSLEEQKCAQIVKIEGTAKLMSIAIDPRNGWLFWGQTSFESFEEPLGEIYRTDTSGSGQINIAHEGLRVVSGIAIDHKRSHLYWVDTILQVIERSNLDGKNRQIFLNQQIYQPLGINIFEDSIYWLMGNLGTLKKCDLHGDRACESINVKTSNVNELFVISQISRQPNVNNICQNHDCNYMCVMRSHEYTCICPNGYITESNTTCGEEAIIDNIVKFETSILGMSNNIDSHDEESGSLTGILITIAVIIVVLSAYYYCRKKKINFRNIHDLSIRFKNPSFARRSTTARVTRDFVVSVLPSSDQRDYTSAMIENQSNTARNPKTAGRRTLEFTFDYPENEQEGSSCSQNTHLID